MNKKLDHEWGGNVFTVKLDDNISDNPQIRLTNFEHPICAGSFDSFLSFVRDIEEQVKGTTNEGKIAELEVKLANREREVADLKALCAALKEQAKLMDIQVSAANDTIKAHNENVQKLQKQKEAAEYEVQSCLRYRAIDEAKVHLLKGIISDAVGSRNDY